MTAQLRSADWRSFALWVIGITVAGLGMVWVLRSESQHQMELAITESGLRWAELAARAVPDLEQVLAGQGLTPAARAQLMHLRRVDDVFRFRLFDRIGLLTLASEDLDLPVAPTYAASQGVGPAAADADRTSIRDRVLAGQSHVGAVQSGKDGAPKVFSAAFVPIQKDGAVLGVAEVHVDQTARMANARAAFKRIGGAVLLLLSIVLGVAAHQLWRRLARQRVVNSRVLYMAHHDVLSGALNRASFNDVLQQAVWRRAQGGPPFALLCIDLDHFKEVNDSLGHAAGDEVLRIATQRLKTCVREGDHIARLGGDEFAVVLMGVANVAAVTPLAQRIVDALVVPYDVADQRLRCSGSVGVAIHGVDATEPDDLLGRADMALYRAKAQGRATFSFYDVAMDRQMQARRQLTHDLREAIGAQQLSLHYQPLFNRDAQTLTGYEALVRWQHPTRGNVPPAEFIALAEETGVIDSIGLWVLRHACAEAARWPAPLTVAVNLSALQFVSNNLVQQVTEALADSGLPPQRLELEITESLLMHNTEQVLSILRALSTLGVSIAMDDFGTGYSSLAYLWRFPFDKVKIDRAFTHNLGHDDKVALIVHSIISLAHSLEIRVNAEGVETPSQLAALQERGCDELQGFLLGRPGPAASLSHQGHNEARASPERRVTPRRPLFGVIPVALPTGHTGPIV